MLHHVSQRFFRASKNRVIALSTLYLSASLFLALALVVPLPQVANATGSTPQTYTVTNVNDSGSGSLRQAILSANSHSGKDNIKFNIAGSGVKTIKLSSALPAITDPVLLDGTSQPGFAGTPLIELNGELVSGAGLILKCGNSTVKGLVINRFKSPGVGIQIQSDGNVITGNYIGTNALGKAALPNAGPGILIQDAADNNLIGGSDTASGNLIAYNNGAGVVIGKSSSDNAENNRVSHNSIFANTGIGIDLGNDGVTLNSATPSGYSEGSYGEGPNDLQTFPLLTKAVIGGTSTTVQGSLKSKPGKTYTLEFFASATCSSTGYGPGQSFLGSATLNLDSTGSANFNLNNLALATAGQFMTATATDPDGNTSEFSACTPITPNIIDLGNHFWTSAYNVPLTETPAGSGIFSSNTISENIAQLNQSDWFKFTIKPGARVTISLKNLPADYDLTLYKDIAAAYKTLTTAQDLVKQSAEFAPDFISPDFISPDFISPDFISPDFISPDFISPDFISPDFISPDFISPDFISPDFISPDFISPADAAKAFSNAQRRSLISYSANDGLADEVVVQNTWDNSGTYYVRVRGRNGAFSTAAPFKLDIMLATGACGNIAPLSSTSNTSVVAGNYKTLILGDLNRMNITDANARTLLTQKINDFKARTEVQGVYIDLGADAKVTEGHNQDTANPTCPYAKNLTAEAIKEIIDAYWKQNPTLEYIVLLGNDEIIPFFRYPEQVDLGQEKNYEPPVKNTSASEASLQLGYILSQDRYGSQTSIDSLNRSLPLPGLAVGRLVETAPEITNMLDAYLKTTAGVVATPKSALVTGYDFIAAGAQEIKNQLQTGLGTGGQSTGLITDPNLAQNAPPCDPSGIPGSNCAWTATNLQNTFLSNRYDLVYLGAHFSQGSLLAADESTRLVASQLAASGLNLENEIVFSTGCHSGYNTVNNDIVVDSQGNPITLVPDWAQAAAQKRITLIAGTGYQYGSDEYIAYASALYVEFSKQLRTGTGPVSLGKALVNAKNNYLASLPQVQGIHDKTVLQIVLYGLPMLSVNLPGTRLPANADASIIPGTTALGGGLYSADTPTIVPTFTSKTVQVTDATNPANKINATYLSGKDGVVVNPGEPFLPLEVRNVSVAGQVLRGVGFRGGSYTDLNNVVPLTGLPATELKAVYKSFSSSTLFPNRFWNTNYFGTLANPVSGATRLLITPAQHVSSTPASQAVTLRRFDKLNFRLFYSDNPATALTGLASIVNVSAVDNGGGNVGFQITVKGDLAPGSNSVWLTYTSVKAGDPLNGKWQSLDLTRNATDSTLWEGTLSGVASVNDLRFIVQAVNNSGLVTLDTFGGAFYTVGVPPVKTATTLTLQPGPTSKRYTEVATFSVTLKDASNLPLAGKLVTFKLGQQKALAVTNASGVATANLQVLQFAGNYTLNASFGGTTTLLSSSASSPFEVKLLDTSLTLRAPTSGEYEQSTLKVAELKDALGRAVKERTVYLLVTGNGINLLRPVITDYKGRAPLGLLAIPPGTYTLSAYFMGNVPTIGNLSDKLYVPSFATTSLSNTPAYQEINFNLSSLTKFSNDTPFQVSATASSGLPVTFSVKSGTTACSVTASGLVTPLSAGVCTLIATQSGNGNYFPASVQNSLTINPPQSGGAGQYQFYDFNALALSNFSATSGGGSIAGRVGVGGDASFSSNTIGFGLNSASNPKGSLVVGGNVTYTNGNVNGGNVIYGGTANVAPYVITNGSLIKVTNPFGVSDVSLLVSGIADAWTALPVNGTTTKSGGTLQLKGSNATRNVFSVNASDLNTTTTLQITAPAGSDVVINVNGTPNTLQSMGISLSGVSADHVVYNFYNATKLTINGVSVPGLIFAPGADAYLMNGNIQGSIVAKNIYFGSFSIQNVPFQGKLP
jgi:choice-of-anchor A domain-containing protein